MGTKIIMLVLGLILGYCTYDMFCDEKINVDGMACALAGSIKDRFVTGIELLNTNGSKELMINEVIIKILYLFFGYLFCRAK